MTLVNPIGGTEQSELVTLVINGNSAGVFDSWSGGDAMAKSAQHRPGGMGPQKSYPAKRTYTDMKVSRVLEFDRDWELVALISQFGGEQMASVTIQPIDPDGNAYGNSRTATGMFLGVSGIKGDSNSEAVQMFDITISVDSF